MERNEIERLMELVLSDDAANVRIAFQIMSANRGDIPIEDVMYILHCVEVNDDRGGFNICDRLCTQAMWEVVMFENPSLTQEGSRSGMDPVNNVSYDSICDWIAWMNENIMPDGYMMKIPRDEQLMKAYGKSDEKITNTARVLDSDGDVRDIAL